MAYFTEVNLGAPAPIDPSGHSPGFWEIAGKAYGHALSSNPLQIIRRDLEMRGLDSADFDWTDMAAPIDAREVIDAKEFGENQRASALPLEEQERQIMAAGLAGQLKPVEGYSQRALEIIIENKRLENLMGAIHENAGGKAFLASIAGGLGAGILDPVNLHAIIVPTIPEQRAVSLLRSASGIGQRAAIRAGLGAASGAAGAAVIEPMISIGQREIQADYTLANSLQNMAFGAMMGAFFHSAGGTLAERARARKGLPQPWEYVPEDYYSQELKKNHAEEIFGARKKADPLGDHEKLRQEAEADAALFDARARNWAYHEESTVGEYYRQWKPEYRARPEFELPDGPDGFTGWRGEEMGGGEVLQHAAMYRDPAADLLEFMEKARAKRAGDKQSYFRLEGEGIPDRANVRIISDMARHVESRHPDLAPEDHLRLYEIAKNITGENTLSLNHNTHYGARHIGRQVIDGAAYGYVFDIASDTVTFTTFFRDAPEKVEAWFERTQKKGFHVGGTPEGTLISPIGRGSPFPRNLSDFIDAVKSKGKQGAILYQQAPGAGRETVILGANARHRARYELRELSEVIPSHDPENQFARRPDYPAIAQERPYHSDPGEQRKVMDNALAYEPGFVISTDSTAANGPPIITGKGIVLGGNSRAMTLQMVYAQFPEKAAAYRKALIEGASQFGIDPARASAMQRPVLVRVVEGEMSPEQMALRSREYNQTTTQQLQAGAEGVSRARFVDRNVIDALQEGLKDGATAAEFLASPESADFAITLLDAGVLQKEEIAALTHSGKGGSGKLNDAGKAKVLAILRGHVLPDYDILSSLPKKALANLDASIPVLALSRMRGEGWDLTGAFFEAMRFVADSRNRKIPVERNFFQGQMAGGDSMRENPAVQALAMLMANGSPKEARLRMEHYLSLARAKGQSALMPELAVKPADAFRQAFLEPLVFVGNERVAGFNPDASPRHAAIQWLLHHKAPTVEKGLLKLEKAIARKKISPEEKALLLEHQRQLAPLSGAVGREEPKLGSFWKDPAAIEIPAPKRPGERGAMPEAGLEPARPAENLNDPDALLPPELREIPEARGQVEFFSEADRPIVTFFQAANVSTAPHELFHVFRRELERTALAPDASLHAREQWKSLCEFAGVKPGGRWTVAMEERFADAGLRYLAEGAIPSPSLAGLFDRLKAWLMELFERAENIGAPISPAMRRTFSEMFAVPYEAADARFRRAVGQLHSQDVARELADPDLIGKPLPETRLSAGDLGEVETLMREAHELARRAASRFEAENPGLAEAVGEANAEISRIDAEMARLERADELRRQAVECIANGG